MEKWFEPELIEKHNQNYEIQKFLPINSDFYFSFY